MKVGTGRASASAVGKGGSGWRQSWAPPVLVLFVVMNSNRQQIAAKAGVDLFVGKKCTQTEPEQVAQPAKTELSAPVFGNLEDVHP